MQTPSMSFDDFPTLLRRARRSSGLSQVALAAVADVSPRHLGFLEVGRAAPSAVMVQRLGKALSLPAIEIDHMLVAAGYAPQGPARMRFKTAEATQTRWAKLAWLAAHRVETPA